MIEQATMSMQTALRFKTTVLTDGKVEIMDPQLLAGEDVEILILLPAARTQKSRSALDIIEDAPGQRLFKTAEEVDTYLLKERQAWER